MKIKRILNSLVILIILFTISSCSNNNNLQSTLSNEPTYEKVYEVKNGGGKFSQNDIIYFILTDRFYDGDKSNNFDVDKNNPTSYHGGDIKGIISKLDYLKSIGTTAIWITPIAKNDENGYHGYWINDFYSVDPQIGTMDDVKNLVQESHKRNIKVLLDFVVNHTGQKTSWLNDGKHNNWFHERRDIVNFEDRSECENGWLAGLPDLNQENKEVSDYLIKNALWWIQNTNVDGFRLDTVKHVPKEFWNRFAYEIKSNFPDFYLIGEVWSGDTSFLELYHRQGIDGLINYPLYFGIRDAFKPFGNINALINVIQSQDRFSSPELNGIFIDNHDNKRFINNIGKDGEKYLKLALVFAMTYPGIPIVYYGTEIAMNGANDPDNRRDMEWEKTINSEVLQDYKTLTQIRHSYPALRSKEIKVLNYDSRFISYKRGTGKDSLLIIINIDDNNSKVTIGNLEEFSGFKDILTNKHFNTNNGLLELDINSTDFMILQPTK